MNFKKIIDPIMTQGEGRVIDVFYELFTLISSFEQEMQVCAFQYMCENIKTARSEDDNGIIVKEHFTDEQLEKYIPRIKEQFTREMMSILFEASKSKLPPKDFYKRIWLLINSNKICKNKREKVLATFWVADSDLIPYRVVGEGISMENDEYISIINSLDNNLVRDMEMIMEIDYEQKTQKSSLLIEKLDTLSTLEEKAVFMSMILQSAEERIKDEIRASIDNI